MTHSNKFLYLFLIIGMTQTVRGAYDSASYVKDLVADLAHKRIRDNPINDISQLCDVVKQDAIAGKIQLDAIPKDDRITLYVACSSHWKKDKAEKDKLELLKKGTVNSGGPLSASEKVSPVRKAVLSVVEQGENSCPKAGKFGRSLQLLSPANKQILCGTCGEYFHNNAYPKARAAVCTQPYGVAE